MLILRVPSLKKSQQPSVHLTPYNTGNIVILSVYTKSEICILIFM